MTKPEIETRWQACHQEQQELAQEVAKDSARIQQLAGQKDLLSEMHKKLVAEENPIVVLPDPPKDGEAETEGPTQ